ncbi:MAG: 23S rRNA (adenine(2503)-C(2))-methyltransferase RlmN [Candidatus Omnitrophica bacterium]|nr:23S rRNA (adenine(2503)-C(2))-methyltransferase RlmN [Candidatus Omnitrophota bacterium]
MDDLKSYSLGELKAYLKSQNFAAFRAEQIFYWIYAKKVCGFDSMTNLPKDLRDHFKSKFYLSDISLNERQISQDGTEKFSFQLNDKNLIESVVIADKLRNTLCISTQAGCRFSCRFCLSGKTGFIRNLSVSEIINQYLLVNRFIAPKKITNIVFMGMGEPLDNFENAVKAITILTDPKAIAFSKRKITISTCGLIPEIQAMKKLDLGVKLSISLHSADNDLREKIMPVNKKYPLKELIQALKKLKPERDGLTFEYLLLSINTRVEDAEKLAKLLKGIKSKVNLIPYNGSNFQFKAPEPEDLELFTQTLKKRGVFFTVRKSKGQDISAACGQLAVYRKEKAK